MDTGVVNLAWCQGYNGSPISYLEPGVLCYQCGRNFKTVSTSGKQGTFSFKGVAVGPIAVHQINKHIASAEYGHNPKIYVYAYPTYNEVSILEGGAELEFQNIAFSESDYLVSISGIPNFNMVLWNYLNGTKLTSVALSSDPVKSVSFSKTNWRQICVITHTNLTLWNSEQCNTKYIFLPQKIKLPAVDHTAEQESEKDEDQSLPRSPTKMSKYVMEIPDSSIAGLVGEQVEQLQEIRDNVERVRPVSLSWLPTGDFYVGCEGGQLFKVDSEMNKTHVLHYGQSQDGSNLFDRGLTSVSRGETDVTEDDSVCLKPGSLKCIAYHQNGLYAAGEDGVVRMLCVSGEVVKILEYIDVGFPISALCFNHKYQSLAWGSPEGIIQEYKCGDPTSVTTLISVHHGEIKGVGGIAFGSECSVSLREDGLVQVWKTVDGTYVSDVSIQEPGETLACNRIAQYTAVGTKSGQLCFIDLTNSHKPRLILRHRLFKNPIKHLLFNGDKGTLLFAASNDNHIFIIDARPTAGFAILGFVGVSGNVQALATYVKDNDTLLVAACNNNADTLGSNLLYRFNFSDELIKDIHKHYKSPMNDIKEESCSALKMGLRHAIYGLAIGEGEVIFSLSASRKTLLTFSMPEPDKKIKKIDLLLSPTSENPGHQLCGGDLALSYHLKWLLTYAPDGYVKIRTIGALDRTAVFTPHQYNSGGIRAVTFSDDCQYILSCGFDGIVSCYHWNHLKNKSSSNSSKQHRDRDMEMINRENQQLSEYHEWGQPPPSMRRASLLEKERKEMVELSKQTAQDHDEIYISPPPSPRTNTTWLEQRELDAIIQENQQRYAGMKHDIRSQIRDIRRTIQNMMGQNRDLPEIEKLGRHEFDLDLEEQNRLQADGDAEIQKVREDIEFENLAKLYLREKIKEECWDKMQVKGRTLQAFNSALEVSNFPLRQRTLDTRNLIQTVSSRRKIEIREVEARKQLVEIKTKPTSHDDEGEDEEEDGKEHPSVSGSLGAQYGGGNDLFYNQFELHTREQKVSQIVLLEDSIHCIKEAFNKEFDEVYSKKEQEMAKVKEKNKRMVKIISDLNLEEEVLEPVMSMAEKPELLLEVVDSEITVEKYLTPEQIKKLEEEGCLEEERIAREKGDNARERALEMMMGGVLEIKLEDELKKDVHKPSFMLTKKEEEWKEDEQKLHKEFLKKVYELNEEREKYRKQLETELRKLQVTIQENLQAYDDTLNVLFMRKIKVMMVTYQEELKILRLRYCMLIQEEIGIREKDLNQTLDHKKHLKYLAFEAVAETRKNYENFKNEFENLMAEDKYLDKSFRRDFNDISAIMVDQLYKQFRRRQRTLKYKAVEPPGQSGKSLNPFSDRPTSSMQLSYQHQQINNGLVELDKITNAPEGCDSDVWERMCKMRRHKLESETLLKVKSNLMADMMSFMHKRQAEDDMLKNEIDNIGHQLSKLKEDEQRFSLNLEVQLLLKQGQIEVDAVPFIRDFRDSVLVHRSVVEDLNSTIKQLGESKIASMVESKDFKKGIIQLEWEHKKMSMLMEDLENKMKDIQFIKVTREIQAFLQEDDYEAKKAVEITTLEQTILLQKKHHEKNVSERKKILNGLHKSLKTKGVSNNILDGDLLDLNVLVNERRHIEEVNADTRDDSGAEKRYQEIVQRRKLVDLAKAQAQEVAILRAEVERLRMRTFPALVQVER